MKKGLYACVIAYLDYRGNLLGIAIRDSGREAVYAQ